jgi:hypothetical protein
MTRERTLKALKIEVQMFTALFNLSSLPHSQAQFRRIE